jgi:hypothetical protein
MIKYHEYSVELNYIFYCLLSQFHLLLSEQKFFIKRKEEIFLRV